VTGLNLGGSRELTDDGLMHLARMPQLEHLELNEYPGGKLTDRGPVSLRTRSRIWLSCQIFNRSAATAS
jgi:hypothetical protein